MHATSTKEIEAVEEVFKPRLDADMCFRDLFTAVASGVNVGAAGVTYSRDVYRMYVIYVVPSLNMPLMIGAVECMGCHCTRSSVLAISKVICANY